MWSVEPAERWKYILGCFLPQPKGDRSINNRDCNLHPSQSPNRRLQTMHPYNKLSVQLLTQIPMSGFTPEGPNMTHLYLAPLFCTYKSTKSAAKIFMQPRISIQKHTNSTFLFVRYHLKLWLQQCTFLSLSSAKRAVFTLCILWIALTSVCSIPNFFPTTAWAIFPLKETISSICIIFPQETILSVMIS